MVRRSTEILLLVRGLVNAPCARIRLLPQFNSGYPKFDQIRRAFVRGRKCVPDRDLTERENGTKGMVPTPPDGPLACVWRCGGHCATGLHVR